MWMEKIKGNNCMVCENKSGFLSYNMNKNSWIFVKVS